MTSYQKPGINDLPNREEVNMNNDRIIIPDSNIGVNANSGYQTNNIRAMNQQPMMSNNQYQAGGYQGQGYIPNDGAPAPYGQPNVYQEAPPVNYPPQSLPMNSNNVVAQPAIVPQGHVVIQPGQPLPPGYFIQNGQLYYMPPQQLQPKTQQPVNQVIVVEKKTVVKKGNTDEEDAACCCLLCSAICCCCLTFFGGH